MIIFIVVAFKSLYGLLNSDYSGSFSFYDRHPDTGEIRILHFEAKKSKAPVNLNLLGVEYWATKYQRKSVSYQRRVTDLWGFDIYVGVSYSQDLRGVQDYGVGFTIGF